VAFDRHGNLWTGDGTTGRGRVWRITPNGAVTEVFRIQTMRNSTALGGTVAGDGVGRQARTFPPGTSTITVAASPTPTVVTPAGGQDLVANGLVFNHQGDLIVADTARGALWKVEFDAKGNVSSRMGATQRSHPTPCASKTFWWHTRCSRAPTASRSTGRATSGTPPMSETRSSWSRTIVA
jgi:sugar lactone lactonase YvrE